MKAKDDKGTSPSKPINYVTAPYYTPTQIRNSIKVSATPYAALSVRTNSNHGFTGGVWSPDSSKKYNNVVG